MTMVVSFELLLLTRPGRARSVRWICDRICEQAMAHLATARAAMYHQNRNHHSPLSDRSRHGFDVGIIKLFIK